MIRFWLLLFLFLPPLSAMAQNGIHRCIGPDGNPLFTDQPCAALQATPVATTSSAASSPAPANQVAAPIAAPPVLCATTVASLRQSVLEAFANRDANRLAGLMIWNGYGREAVVADIRSLSGLMQRPLLDVTEASDDPPPAPPADSIYDVNRSPDALAGASSTPPSASPGGDRQLVVRTAADDGSGVARETRFGVVKRSGCLWLHGSG
ncbi:DUF4124 domain-containing protein [Dyella sp. 20L07]|uniref:DUF4124 domain-containing protein n=1 Tax=Dyella sp. 20L07 TaxID=3384240 RepID=UPI003D2CA305